MHDGNASTCHSVKNGGFPDVWSAYDGDGGDVLHTVYYSVNVCYCEAQMRYLFVVVIYILMKEIAVFSELLIFWCSMMIRACPS